MHGGLLGLYNSADKWNGFRVVAKTFFKWPGSKGWLVSKLKGADFDGFTRVVEPFAGSAAFFLGSKCSEALLGDTNEHVISSLVAVRDFPHDVIRYLSALRNSKACYERVKFSVPEDDVEAAGRLIFLTNTSWGGLYRENRAGKFNVPYGDNGRAVYSKVQILDASEKLKGAKVFHCGYEDTIRMSRKGDLIFVDAPYVTTTKDEHFDRYHSHRFTWDDQLELARVLTQGRAASKSVIVTCAANADLYQLFGGWHVYELSKRNSMTAYLDPSSYRSEALILSPALTPLAHWLEERQLAVKVARDIGGS